MGFKKKHSSLFDENGKYIPGSITTLATYSQEPKQTVDPSDDTKNRDKVVNEIIGFVENGASLEEACEALSKDQEIIDKFKYLPQESLKQVFMNWYNGRVRQKKDVETGVRAYRNGEER